MGTEQVSVKADYASTVWTATKRGFLEVMVYGFVWYKQVCQNV